MIPPRGNQHPITLFITVWKGDKKVISPFIHAWLLQLLLLLLLVPLLLLLLLLLMPLRLLMLLQLMQLLLMHLLLSCCGCS